MNPTEKKYPISSISIDGSKRLPKLHWILNRLLSMLLLGAGLPIHALPVGGQVRIGQGTIKENGSTLTVTQNSQKLSIDWRTFDIGSAERVNFAQASTSSIALNRILRNNASQIYGQLTANGQVFLLNPNGILFGKTAQVNVGGIVASTLDLSDADFMAGKFYFNGHSGSLVNQGVIATRDGGYVALLGGTVSNEGRIVAQGGTVALASGQRITLDFSADQLINLQIDQGILNALVENREWIQADGGQVILTARGRDALFSGVVNNTGLIQAQTSIKKNGVIRLLGGAQNDTVQVAGTLDAAAPNGGHGGQIETSAAHVHIGQGTRITATAADGQSGQWLLNAADIDVDAGLAKVLQSTLNNGTNMSMAALPIDGSGAGDITLSAPLTWSSAGNLAFDASRDIRLNANLTGSGGGNVALRADAQGTGNGTVRLDSDHHISLSGGNGAPGQNGISIYYNPLRYSDAATRSDTNGNPYAVGVTQGVLTAFMLVNDATQLQDMRTNLAGNYGLGKNIDAAGTANTHWDAASASYLGFAPLGDAAMPFGGTLDGLGHSIIGLTVKRPLQDYAGLFGNNSGSVRNIGIENASITGQNHVGALAGYNSGTISNAHASGMVSADFATEQSNSHAFASGAANGSIVNVGGLVGYNSGTIDHAHAADAVSVNLGNIIAYDDTLGRDAGAAVSDANAIGGLNHSSLRIGGLVGYNSGSISDANASGAVSGIVGNTTAYATSRITANGAGTDVISHASAIGAVSDSQIFIGGLAGYNDGVLRNTYATGSVTGNIGSTNAIALATVSGNTDGATLSSHVVTIAHAVGAVRDSVIGIGGLIGLNRGEVLTSYATGDVSGAIGATRASTSGDVDVHAIHGESADAGIFSHADAERALSGSAVAVGGLAGYNLGYIRDAYAMGAVNGNVGATGAQAAGRANTAAGTGGIASSATYTEAFATDAKSGLTAIGGLIGNNAGNVIHAYATGHTTASPGALVGALVGKNTGNDNATWSIDGAVDERHALTPPGPVGSATQTAPIRVAQLVLPDSDGHDRLSGMHDTAKPIHADADDTGIASSAPISGMQNAQAQGGQSSLAVANLDDVTHFKPMLYRFLPDCRWLFDAGKLRVGCDGDIGKSGTQDDLVK